MQKYECDNCGACCKTLLVEAYDLDVMREPRLAEADIHRDELSYDQLMADLEQDGRCLILASSTGPCPFHEEDKQACTIYPTRPNVCVAMQAGDEQCQSARKEVDLPPLPPVAEF